MQNFNVQSLFELSSSQSFNDYALQIFHHQAQNNVVYRDFLKYSNQLNKEVNLITEIPFMPISLFKTHKVIDSVTHQKVFSSSGTGGLQSKHYIKDLKVYECSYKTMFEKCFGRIEDHCILCLLPSYLERDGSSLIYMAEGLVSTSSDPRSGFFLYDHEALLGLLKTLKAEKKRTILLGVTFALLDFVETHCIDFPDLVVMETGGMKGRKKELTRSEVHTKLKYGFGVPKVYSEYGMTELLSQAYTTGEEIFYAPPWMKILKRETTDPLNLDDKKGRGALNIIDLANIYSCAFIATDDLGELCSDGGFKVLGRLDSSDIRGCSLMVQ